MTRLSELVPFVEHFRHRILQDALTEATSAYWLRRAESFEAAMPAVTDYIGNATPTDLEQRRGRLEEIALACRRAAEMAPLQIEENYIREVGRMTLWRVVFDAQTAFVAGPKTEARRRVAACGDRSPLWVQRRGAWATSPAVANKVLAQLKAHNYSVSSTDTAQLTFDLSDTAPANVLDRGTLW